MDRYSVEYTDTFGGEANYSWVKRATVEMPDWTHFKSDGNFRFEPNGYRPMLMRKAKAAMGLTNVRGKVIENGGDIEFRPCGSNTVMFINYSED